MTRTLQLKWAFIVVVVLVCLYGIIGIPRSTADIANNFRKNISLGLDLRGGSQLVMQVQVQDAFKVEADATIDRLKDEFKKAGVDYARSPLIPAPPASCASSPAPPRAPSHPAAP